GPTVSLAVLTILFAIIISIPAAIVSAYNKDNFLDKLIIALSVVGFSMPVFVSGYVLIWLFSMQWNLFPSHGYTPLSENPLKWLHSLVLPSLALAIVYISLITRIA